MAPAVSAETPADDRLDAADGFAEVARAKVNLWLHVTGRRPDGYHLLDSLVAFTELGDRLTLRPDEPLSLRVTGPYGPALVSPGDRPETQTGDPAAPAGQTAGDDNLVLRAAHGLAQATGRMPRGAFLLDKRLPVASGIGGGSADAAAALRLLVRAWGIDPDAAFLAPLALSLGADVPVCLGGRTARMSGIGETLEPAPNLAGVPILLVNPNRPVSTPAVFRGRHGPFSAPAPEAVLSALAASSGAPQRATALANVLREATANDLEAPAVAAEPAVGEVLEDLTALPGCRLSRMSGSGATCFALFDDARRAGAAAGRLAAARPGWWIAATRIA